MARQTRCKGNLTLAQIKAIQKGAQRIAQKHGITLRTGKALRLAIIKDAVIRINANKPTKTKPPSKAQRTKQKPKQTKV